MTSAAIEFGSLRGLITHLDPKQDYLVYTTNRLHVYCKHLMHFYHFTCSIMSLSLPQCQISLDSLMFLNGTLV